MMKTHQTGLPQSSLLLLGSCLPVLGAVLLAPVLPQIQAHFADNPMASVLVPISLTLPALMIALFSPIAGLLADKWGRKHILLVSMLLYSICGVLPLWLASLEMIVLTRAGIGLAEAGIMTCCTTLMGDYFDGKRRERLFALQMVVTSLSATIFISIGGVLGHNSWRAPFWLYASGILFLPLMAYVLWEPLKKVESITVKAIDSIPWKSLTPYYFLSVIAGISLFIAPVQTGYLLNLIDINDPSQIGLTIGCNQLGVLLGAFAFQALPHHYRTNLIIMGLVITGIGSLLMAYVHQYVLLTLAVSLSGIGVGIMMPTLITCIMSFVTFEQQRGRVAGLFTAMIFLGEFLSPVIVLAITHGNINQIPKALFIMALCQLAIGALIAIRIVKIQPPSTSKNQDQTFIKQ